MNVDGELKKTLVEMAQHYHDRVPVFSIRQRSISDLERDAVELAQRFAVDHGMKDTRFSIQRKPERTTVQLPENARLHLFHTSGVMTAERGWSPIQNLISKNAAEVDRESFIKQAHEAIRRLGLNRSRLREDLRFERLWQLKASGMTQEAQKGTAVVARVVTAFRRYLLDIPVWGRASVFTKLASEGQVDSWGLDWRPVSEDPIDEVYTLNPDEGAERVLEELQTTLPGGNFTREDFEPELFALGYFSLPKRRPQNIMQPVWVSMLRSQGWTSLSRLIVVPAVSTPYEPICRTVQLPPLDAMRPSPGLRT